MMTLPPARSVDAPRCWHSQSIYATIIDMPRIISAGPPRGHSPPRLHQATFTACEAAMSPPAIYQRAMGICRRCAAQAFSVSPHRRAAPEVDID